MYLKKNERFIYYSNCNKHNKNTNVKYMINTKLAIAIATIIHIDILIDHNIIINSGVCVGGVCVVCVVCVG